MSYTEVVDYLFTCVRCSYTFEDNVIERRSDDGEPIGLATPSVTLICPACDVEMSLVIGADGEQELTEK